MVRLGVSQFAFLLALVIMSFLSAIVIVSDVDRPLHYSLLPLLPLSYGLVNLMCARLYRAIPSNIGLTMMVILYFVRHALSPALMTWSGYQSLIKVGIAYNAENAILLSIYELASVYLVSYVYCLRHPQVPTSKVFSSARSSEIVVLCMVMYAAMTWVAIPECRELFKTMFDMTSADFTSTFYDYRAHVVGSKRAALTLFSLTMNILVILVPAYAIYWARTRFLSRPLSLGLSMLFMCTPLLFVTSTVAQSVISVFVLMLFLSKLYSIRVEHAYIRNIAVCGVFTAIYFIVRFRAVLGRYSTSLIEYFSMIVNAYFSGVDNIAGIWNIPALHRWESLFFNAYGAIPFNTTLFGLDGPNLQSLFNTANLSQGQIPPAIGAGYYYFGFAFAPVFCVAMAYLAAWYGSRAISERNLWKYVAYTLSSVVMAMGLVMYNEAIVLRWFTGLLLPILLLARHPRNGKRQTAQACVPSTSQDDEA